MGEMTKIQWCDHTFNHVRGCTKVSPGCAHCYAETLSKRNPAVLGEWGPNGTRVVASEATWRDPLKWERMAAYQVAMAEKYGWAQSERPRVFCASLADVFEDWPGQVVNAAGEPLWATPEGCPTPWIAGERRPNPDVRPLGLGDVRRRLARLVWETSHLDWLFLTKRPENAESMIYAMWFPDARWPRNWWLGVSVEDQQRADERIPHLLKTPAAVRFLSCEPLLAAVDLTRIEVGGRLPTWNALAGDRSFLGESTVRAEGGHPKVDWVIVGGESGPKARPMCFDWAESIVHQCKAASVPVFVKQLGARPFAELRDANNPGYRGSMECRYRDRKGGDPSEWSESLRVREFPAAPAPAGKEAM